MSDKETADLTKLDGSNYAKWKHGINFLLHAKGLMEHVDGSYAEPDSDTAAQREEWKKWRKSQSQAAVILMSSVDRSLHDHLLTCDTPKEIWDKLASLYGEATENLKEIAWEQFYNFRIKEGESMKMQLERLDSICKKLELAKEKVSDSSLIIKVLKSLPSRLSMFRMAWECTPEDEKKKAKLFARLIKEDERLAENEEIKTTLALKVNAISLRNKEVAGEKSYPSTARSDKDFHKKRKKLSIQELKKRTKCAKCGEKGHWARECSTPGGKAS